METNFLYKENDGGRKELFSMLIYRPMAKVLLFSLFKNSRISPNQISFLSLCAALSAAYCFAVFYFPMNLFGVLLLHLTYTLDMLDGTYARYKGLSSKLGKWLDPFFDVIKLAAIFPALTWSAYRVGAPSAVFLWGMAAMANAFLSYYVINTRSQIMPEVIFEVKLKKTIYVGYEISLYWALSLIVVFNMIYPGLILLATFGSLSWIKVVSTMLRYYRGHKTEIEKGGARG